MANIHGLTIALLRFDQWLCGILRDAVEKTLLDKRQITHVFDVGIWVWKFYGATMENYRSYYVMLYYTCGKTISKPDGLSSFPYEFIITRGLILMFRSISTAVSSLSQGSPASVHPESEPAAQTPNQWTFWWPSYWVGGTTPYCEWKKSGTSWWFIAKKNHPR